MLNGEDVSDGRTELRLTSESPLGEYRCVAQVPLRAGIGDVAWAQQRRDLQKSKSGRIMENHDGGLTALPLSHPNGSLSSPPIRVHSLIDDNIFFEKRPIRYGGTLHATTAHGEYYFIKN